MNFPWCLNLKFKLVQWSGFGGVTLQPLYLWPLASNNSAFPLFPSKRNDEMKRVSFFVTLHGAVNAKKCRSIYLYDWSIVRRQSETVQMSVYLNEFIESDKIWPCASFFFRLAATDGRSICWCGDALAQVLLFLTEFLYSVQWAQSHHQFFVLFEWCTCAASASYSCLPTDYTHTHSQIGSRTQKANRFRSI